MWFNKLEPILRKVEAILSKTPASAVGSLIYYAGDEEFFEFMKQEGMSTFSPLSKRRTFPTVLNEEVVD